MKAPTFEASTSEAEIRAFILSTLAPLRADEAAVDRVARMPTLRGLQERFKGSYTRLNRIRRQVRDELLPPPAPAAAIDVGPLIEAAVAKITGQLLKRLDPMVKRAVDQAARAASRGKTAPPAPPPVRVDLTQDLMSLQAAIEAVGTSVGAIQAVLAQMPIPLTAEQVIDEINKRRRRPPAKRTKGKKGSARGRVKQQAGKKPRKPAKKRPGARKKRSGRSSRKRLGRRRTPAKRKSGHGVSHSRR